MALRNTLLVCTAIVAGGAIAGVSMQPGLYAPQQAYDTSSNTYGEPAPYGAAQPTDPSGAPSQQYGAPQQQPYGQSAPPPEAVPYGQQPPQQYGQQQYGPSAPPPGAQPYGPPQQQQYGAAPYGSEPSYGAQSPAPRQTSDQQMVSLSEIENADRILPRMPVESSNGQRIGEVAQVRMVNGRAREVLLDQGTRIQASDLMYVPARSVLVAQATVGERPNSYDPRGPQGGQYGPPTQPAPQGRY
jgi:hypothetical protein